MITRFFTRLLIVGLLVCFGIFYGVDLATHGIESIHGQVDNQTSVAEVEQAKSELEADDVTEPSVSYDQAMRVQDATLVGSLADATGTVLQRTARGGIELIVSVFDGILH